MALKARGILVLNMELEARTSSAGHPNPGPYIHHLTARGHSAREAISS